MVKRCTERVREVYGDAAGEMSALRFDEDAAGIGRGCPGGENRRFERSLRLEGSFIRDADRVIAARSWPHHALAADRPRPHAQRDREAGDERRLIPVPRVFSWSATPAPRNSPRRAAVLACGDAAVLGQLPRPRRCGRWVRNGRPSPRSPSPPGAAQQAFGSTSTPPSKAGTSAGTGHPRHQPGPHAARDRPCADQGGPGPRGQRGPTTAAPADRGPRGSDRAL